MRPLTAVFFLALCYLTGCADAALQQELDAAKERILQLETQLKEKDMGKTGFIHAVYFYTDKELSTAELTAWEAGIRTLGTISTVEDFYVGPPAGTPREVVDNTYAFALLVHFADKAAHDAYQTDPIHLKFIEEHKDKWSDVKIYDCLVP